MFYGTRVTYKKRFSVGVDKKNPNMAKRESKVLRRTMGSITWDSDDFTKPKETPSTPKRTTPTQKKTTPPKKKRKASASTANTC